MTSVITKKNFRQNLEKSISRDEAEKAVETLIRWAGDDPTREGLRDTPRRVIDAFNEFFPDMANHPRYLSKTFEDVQGL